MAELVCHAQVWKPNCFTSFLKKAFSVVLSQWYLAYYQTKTCLHIKVRFSTVNILLMYCQYKHILDKTVHSKKFNNHIKKKHNWVTNKDARVLSHKCDGLRSLIIFVAKKVICSECWKFSWKQNFEMYMYKLVYVKKYIPIYKILAHQ